MLLFGAGEAFAGAASDVNADTVGCFDQAIGGSPGGIWYLSATNLPAAATQWTEFGPRTTPWKAVVGKFAGGNAFGLGVADTSGATALFLGIEDPTNQTGVPDAFAALPVEASVSPSNDPIPLTGNWTGGGNPGVGLYYPDAGVFVIDTAPGNPTTIEPFLFGPVDAGNVIPIVGDFNGNGDDTVGVYYRTNGYFYLANTIQQTPAATNPAASEEINASKVVFAFGPPGNNWIPIAGNWDLQGGDSVGLYDPATGVFYLKNDNNDSNSGGDGLADIITTIAGGGAAGDCQPVAGNWNIGVLP